MKTDKHTEGPQSQNIPENKPTSEGSLKHCSFLYEAAQTLNTTLNLNEILQQLMNLTHQYFQPDAVSVALVEPGGSLVFKAASGEAAQKIKGMRLSSKVGIVGWVASHGKPLWIPDVSKDPRFYAGTDQETGFMTQAIYAVPVQYGEYTMAVLEIINPPSALEPANIQEIMLGLASLAAPAIRNAALFRRVSEAETRYQRLFEHNIDPIVILNSQGTLLDRNHAAKKLLAIPQKIEPTRCLEILGLTPEQFTEFKKVLEQNKVVSWEAVLETSRGEECTLEIHLTLLDHYTPEAAYQWLAHDVTDRVALETMREQLSHMIVHDLRNPLGNISNSLELIRNAWLEKDTTMPVDQIVRIALRSAQRMERLISNILDLARLRAQEKTLILKSINIPKLVGEIEETITPSLRHRHQSFSKDIEKNIPRLIGDPDLIRRVLTNLLDNAIKFTPNRGLISLAITHNEQEFQFAVSDTGTGIAAEDLEHIFEIYVRGKNTGSARGSGVGLAFCKLVVEAHGGRIWVKSTPDKGSIFIFTIPQHIKSESKNE